VNRTLVEHWQSHGLVIIDNQNSDWNWSDKGNAVHPKVREQLERFEAGSLVLMSMYRLVREAGFSPHTCMLVNKKEDSRIYTLQDFINMSVADLFGFWCLVKLNYIECPDPKDYSEIYEEFTDAQTSKLCDYLANERINKP